MKMLFSGIRATVCLFGQGEPDLVRTVPEDYGAVLDFHVAGADILGGLPQAGGHFDKGGQGRPGCRTRPLIKIWQLGLKQSDNKKLPIVIPLVLYHGRDKWKVGTNLTSVFQGPVDALKTYIPDFEYILYDLSRYSDDQIEGTVMARVTMLLLKHIFNPDFSNKLPDIMALLKDLSEKETGLQ